jgi:hypothetical protein
MLVIPPLFVITLFCFGFVLLQSPTKLSKTAVASSHRNSPVGAPQPALPPLAVGNAPELPKLSTEPVLASPSGTANNPQPAGQQHTGGGRHDLQVSGLRDGNSLLSKPKDDKGR